MSKPRTGTITLDGDEPSVTDPLEGVEAPRADEIDAAFAITDELRGTAGVSLQFTRVWPTTPGAQGHCGEMGAEEYSLAEAARRYGPGRYTVRLKGPDNRYMRGGGKLNIAGNPTGATPAPPPAQGSSEMVALLESMNRRDEERQRATDSRNEKFWALALAAVPVIPAIIGAMKGGGGESTAALIAALKPAPAPTMAEVVATLQGLKALNNDKPATDPIDQLSKLLEVAQNLGGKGEGGESGSNWIDLVRDGLKAAPDLLGVIQSRGPQSVPVHVMPQAPTAPLIPTVTAESAATPEVIPTEAGDMLALIQPILKDCAVKMENWAKAGKNAQLRAEVLFDDLPQWLIDRIKPAQALELLNNPQWWEHLITFHPPLAAFGPWVREMRLELIAIVEAQIEDEKKEAPPGKGNSLAEGNGPHENIVFWWNVSKCTG